MDKIKIDVRNVPITLQIGKSGITDGILQELDKQLSKRKVVKVRLLRSLVEQVDKNDAAQELATRTKSTLVDRTGFIVVLYRPTKEPSVKREPAKQDETAQFGAK